jgi:hypothetical protein
MGLFTFNGKDVTASRPFKLTATSVFCRVFVGSRLRLYLLKDAFSVIQTIEHRMKGL